MVKAIKFTLLGIMAALFIIMICTGISTYATNTNFTTRVSVGYEQTYKINNKGLMMVGTDVVTENTDIQVKDTETFESISQIESYRRDVKYAKNLVKNTKTKMDAAKTEWDNAAEADKSAKESAFNIARTNWVNAQKALASAKSTLNTANGTLFRSFMTNIFGSPTYWGLIGTFAIAFVLFVRIKD